MDRVRVFLLDDHEVVRRGLRDLLEASGDIEIVGESGSAAKAERRIPALRPQIAVLDARLPDGSGIDVCREVRSRDATISCLILTSFDDDEALFNAIMAGPRAMCSNRSVAPNCWMRSAESPPGSRYWSRSRPSG